MTRAVRFHTLGGPEVLQFEDVAPRRPGKGEVELAVTAVGLNRADSMYFRGIFKEKPVLPSGLGAEAVGTVTAVGPDGDTTLIGKRVGTICGYSLNEFPVLSERAIVAAESVAAFPDTLSDVEGAAIWFAFCTAYGALVQFHEVVAGDFVLITAASSSVALAAIQIVKAQGATSIATTRTAKKRDQLLRLGADHVIVTDDEDLPARVKAITGGKLAQIVFDCVGGDYINVLAEATASGGTILLYGLLSGETTPFPMSAFARSIGMYGYSYAAVMDPAQLAAMKTYIYDRLVDGRFKVEIAKVFPFAQTADAFQYLESNEQIGKIVVTF